MAENDVNSSKKKIFYVLDILRKYSDEDHPITAQQIVDRLQSLYNVKAERKSIYRDINVLKSCDYDIIKIAGDGFSLLERSFEVAEIRLLNDAILGARFITPKKTKELSEKLRRELSVYQAKKIETQTYFDNRVKFTNEHILYVIDTIHTAISENKKITFGYYRKKIVNNQICRYYDRNHTISPYALVWSEDKYYLVGNYEKYDDISHYRLDRMENVTITNEQSRSFEEVSKYKNRFDVGDYASRTFQMFSGTDEMIDLICSNDILERVIDKLGEYVHYMSVGKDKFRVRVRGYDSEGLIEWLMMLSNRCYVVSPESLRKRVIERANEIIQMQNNHGFAENKELLGNKLNNLDAG